MERIKWWQFRERFKNWWQKRRSLENFREAKFTRYSEAENSFREGKVEGLLECAEPLLKAVDDGYRAGQEAEGELLQKAVELIKIWHNGEAVMKLGQEQADYMWNIYYNNAPEMKEIRQALKGETDEQNEAVH